jgi:hypothetical protein
MNISEYYINRNYYEHSEFWEAMKNWACNNGRKDKRSIRKVSKEKSIWKAKKVVARVIGC